MWKPSSPPPQSAASPDEQQQQQQQQPAEQTPGRPRQESLRQPVTGRRIAQIVKLKPEFVAKYKEVHAAVWPEVLQQIKACNIRDCKFFNLSLIIFTFHLALSGYQAFFSSVNSSYFSVYAVFHGSALIRVYWGAGRQLYQIKKVACMSTRMFLKVLLSFYFLHSMSEISYS